MKNGKLDQFLDTGWYSEATLYLDGYIYWCEAQTNETGSTTFFVDKWAAENEDNAYYHSILNADGTLTWNRVFEYTNSDLDYIKKRFLEATIFDNKSFWQVEQQLAWLDEGNPVTKSE